MTAGRGDQPPQLVAAGELAHALQQFGG